MGLGILEARSSSPVPGTVALDDGIGGSLPGTNLKRGADKYKDIILAPQPSEDPNDPLNWSWLQKHVTLAVVSMGTIIVSVAPVCAPHLVTIIEPLHLT